MLLSCRQRSLQLVFLQVLLSLVTGFAGTTFLPDQLGTFALDTGEQPWLLEQVQELAMTCAARAPESPTASRRSSVLVYGGNS